MLFASPFLFRQLSSLENRYHRKYLLTKPKFHSNSMDDVLARRQCCLCSSSARTKCHSLLGKCIAAWTWFPLEIRNRDSCCWTWVVLSGNSVFFCCISIWCMWTIRFMVVAWTAKSGTQMIEVPMRKSCWCEMSFGGLIGVFSLESGPKYFIQRPSLSKHKTEPKCCGS